ncbi:MAG: hypothetical protein KGL39_00155 [Patescibacteria group bacterium]|nr:hypothetical protein [Patescibacteria group bacterium]
MPHHYNLYLPDPQWERLQALSDHTDMTGAEIIRKVVDYGFQESVLNQIIPWMSGSLKFSSER